jgi:hypothetical protein
VNASSRQSEPLRIQIRNTVQVLQTVKVAAMQDLGLQRVGFDERQKWGMGKFYTPRDIERRDPLRLNYLLETAPMLRTGMTNDGKRYITGRFGDCIRYYIDGFLQAEISAKDLDFLPDSYLSAAELGAVEVYDKLSAPAEFMGYSRDGNPCSVVVIWTKWKLRM